MPLCKLCQSFECLFCAWSQLPFLIQLLSVVSAVALAFVVIPAIAAVTRLSDTTTSLAAEDSGTVEFISVITQP
jgi:hypothetical protein